MNAPVANPAAFSRVAAVTVPAATRNPLLSRMPCSYGRPSRENRRVRHERDDGVRVGEREARPVGRQRVERRRRDWSAVGRQHVGAQRVDRDEQDVLIGIGRRQHVRRAPEGPPSDRREHGDHA